VKSQRPELRIKRRYLPWQRNRIRLPIFDFSYDSNDLQPQFPPLHWSSTDLSRKCNVAAFIYGWLFIFC